MVRAQDLQRGTQIIYVPTHAEGNENHPDCERGFVTSVKPDAAFCRYWSKYHPGELRTKMNSELTPLDCLVVKKSVADSKVEQALRAWC